MDALRWLLRPTLRRPVLVAAFEGWNDAGDAATMAAKHFSQRWMARPFAEIDPEEFYDFTSTRPQVTLIDGETRSIVWPTNTFAAGKIPGSNRDVIVLTGSEPQLKWRTFCELVMMVVRAFDVEFVMTLGALLADSPHTRPVRITASATDPDIVSRLSVTRSRYEGPTGIVGVLHEALAREKVGSASLWAAVPHYLPGTPSPKAALALVERTAAMLNTTVPVLDLQIAATQYERQVNEVVEGDEDMARYVRQLEQSHDNGDDEDDDDDDDDAEDDDEAAGLDAGAATGKLTDEFGNLPSGDALAAEVEKFLRDHGSGPGPIA